MKKIFTLLFLSGCIFSSAQNLVPNSSFDVQDSCPAVSELFVCQPWNSPTLGTPDAFNSTCPTQNTPGRTGIGSAGIFLLTYSANYREYMQAPLTSALTGGQMYNVSFWVYRSNYRYAVNRIGAYFSVGAVNDMTTTSVLPYIPQVENPATTMLSASGWMMISGSFVASGGEDHIIIGNFSNDSETDTAVINASSSSKVANYHVDDVSVTSTVSSINDIHASENMISVFPNPSTGKFYLKAEPLKKSEIKIYNSTGNIVYESYLPTGKTEIDISDLPRGLYFIIMNSEEIITAKKIILQ